MSASRNANHDPLTMKSGALAALSAWPLVLLETKTVHPLLHGREAPVAAFGCACVALSAFAIVRAPTVGRVLATLGVALVVAGKSPLWLSDPSLALLSGILLVSGQVWLWSNRIDWLGGVSAQLVGGSGYLRGAIGAALPYFCIWMLGGARQALPSLLPVTFAGATASLLGLWRIFHRLPVEKLRGGLLLGVYALSALTLVFWWDEALISAGLPLLCAVFVGLALRRRTTLSVDQGGSWEPLLGHPERLFVGTFALLSLVGSAALSLPISTPKLDPLPYIDALFTATSAVCVTGLSTIDPSRDLTGVGQGFVLLLIQVGGLGIMTFSTVLLWALGSRMSLRHEGAVAMLLSPRDRGRLFDSARQIFAFTMVTEILGAILLTSLFHRAGDAFGAALWRGVFTSISAFCNAGFALQTDNLIPYQGDPLILHTVALLIILGGLSPIAVFALPSLIRGSVQPVAVQARLALVMAALLCFAGFALILAFEWQESLSGLSFFDKLNNAWFQSVTLRTAGFNSVDLRLIQPATLTIMILWMFIGGSPGSTAGGVKTTTIAILLLSVMQTIRGQSTLEVFGRTIPEKTKTRAVAVTCIAASTGLLGLLSLQLTQDMPEREAWFEIFSALGTVGLTIGGTSRLDGVGKVIIIACMFIGRVGGLTLLMFLSSQKYSPRIGRPVEEVDVG